MALYEGGETSNRGLLTRSGVSVQSDQDTAYIAYWIFKYYYIYYPLKNLFDGNVNTFYASSARNVKISITFPRLVFIHHLEIYPVSKAIFNSSI